MTWDNEKYVKLLLERIEGKKDKWLMALRTTADYYGWSQEFPTWTPKTAIEDGALVLVRDPGRRAEMFCETGTQLRISRSKSRNGHPARFVNRFKVSSNCTLWDIAEVAHFTHGDWYWMTSPVGTRVLKGNWEARYQSREPQQRRGLVPA